MSAPFPGLWCSHGLSERLPAGGDRSEWSGYYTSTKVTRR
jgi:hypothetical protein